MEIAWNISTNNIFKLSILHSIIGLMNRPAKTFRDLIVWQKAHQFVLVVYELTEKFPLMGTQIRF